MRKSYDRCVDELGVYLAGEGFERSGDNFLKTCDRYSFCIQVASFETTKGTDLEFTMNVGVFIREPFEVYYEEKCPEYPTVSDCVLRRSLTELKRLEEDEYFVLDSNSRLEELIEKIKEDMNQYVFPYFDKIKSIQDVIERVEEDNNFESPTFVMVMLIFENRTSEAEEKLNQFRESCIHEAQLNFVEEVMHRARIAITKGA